MNMLHISHVQTQTSICLMSWGLNFPSHCIITVWVCICVVLCPHTGLHGLHRFIRQTLSSPQCLWQSIDGHQKEHSTFCTNSLSFFFAFLFFSLIWIWLQATKVFCPLNYLVYCSPKKRVGHITPVIQTSDWLPMLLFIHRWLNG